MIKIKIIDLKQQIGKIKPKSFIPPIFTVQLRLNFHQLSFFIC